MSFFDGTLVLNFLELTWVALDSLFIPVFSFQFVSLGNGLCSAKLLSDSPGASLKSYLALYLDIFSE